VAIAHRSKTVGLAAKIKVAIKRREGSANGERFGGQTRHLRKANARKGKRRRGRTPHKKVVPEVR